MKEFEFSQQLWLVAPRSRVFPFFADAHNLQVLTPPWLKFEVMSQNPIEMRPGALINYKLKVHGLPVRWQSEITVWEPPDRFVDEQRRGPYRRWIHEHRFEDRDGGTVCHDHVRYAVLGGRLINRLLVRRDIAQIFEFRRKKLNELFSSK